MARKQKILGNYVRDRRKKYQHPCRLFFHVSAAPRKVLVPHRTTWNGGDEERQQALLFLCPLHDIKVWTDWYLSKFPKSRSKDVRDAVCKGGRLVLYVHIVRVNPADLAIPQKRFDQEFIVRKALRPLAIVPVRFTYGKPLQLSRVFSKIEQIKEAGRGGRRVE
nr:hypothetical protein [Candidatus Sigynarchaeota archaeon]